MTCINNTKSKRHLSAKLAAGIAISALVVLGTLASASAEERRVVERGGWDRGGWGGGYYRAPPVVYGRPYGYGYGHAPPVVYGPGIGVRLPGVGIHIW